MSGTSRNRVWASSTFEAVKFLQRFQKYPLPWREGAKANKITVPPPPTLARQGGRGWNGEFKCIWLCIIWLLPLFGCATTFHGKVIDYDTREPIDGAVVVLHWNEARATIAGESTRLKAVKETLTDKNGEWTIMGPRGKEGSDPLRLFTFLTGSHYTRKPEMIVFKPGYCSWPKGFFLDACKGKMKTSDTPEVMKGKTVELPKLKAREDRLGNLPGPIAGKGSLEEQIEFIRLLNEESRNLGISEYK